MDYPIRIVAGNWFKLVQPLSKIVWKNSTREIVDYEPQEGDTFKVTLIGSYSPYEMENAHIKEDTTNVLVYENNGTLPLGMYDIEIRVVLADGKRLRSYQTDIVKIVKTNKEASIPNTTEFGIDTFELQGAVFMYVPTGEGGSLEQVQADWEQDDSSEVDYIKNKPTIPSASDTTPLMDGVGNSGSLNTFARADHRHPSDTTKQDVINDLADIRSGASKGNTAYQKPSSGIPKTDLESSVQTSLGKADNAIQKSSSNTGLLKPDGSIDSNTYLTQHQDISGKANTSDLSDVAFSGSYNDLKNKPTIPSSSGDVNVIEEVQVNGVALVPDSNKAVNVQVPTNNNQLANGAGYITSADIAGKEDKVAIITPELDNNNAFNATVGNYYKVTGNASAIDITLVTPSDTSHLTNCIFLIDNSNGVGASFHTQNLPFYQAANFAIATGKIYEVNALFNGTAWYLTQVEMEVQS